MRSLPIIIMTALGVSMPASAQNSLSSELAARCASMYIGALQRVRSSQQVSVAIETMKRNACNAENFNLDAGFDSNTKSIVQGLPVVSSLLGSLKISNNKQFCEAINQGRLNIDQVDDFTVDPVVEAMGKANECIKIATASGVAITHASPDPSMVLFSARFGTSDDHTFKFSGLTSGGFQCLAPRTDEAGMDILGTTTIGRKKNFAILCSRAGEPVSGQSGDVDFKQGIIGITTSDGNVYSVNVPGDTLYGLQSRMAAQSKLSQANADTAAAIKERDLTKKRLTGSKTVYFYFNHTHLGPGPGVRFDCGQWNSGRAIQIATAAVCPNGSLIDMHQSASGGGDCGYNAFSAICVPD